MLFEFLKIKNECTHPNIAIDAEEAYCPDCGALVKNKWYIMRCGCCNIKRKAHFEYDRIKPDTKFCPNCGSNDFYIQEPDSINIIDVRYALLKKIIIPQTHHSTHQLWIEKEEAQQEERKLLKLNK